MSLLALRFSLLFLNGSGSSGLMGGNLLTTGLIWVGFFVLLYFLIIRPQKKKQKAVQNTLNELSVGNKVVTIGGFVGKIKKIDDDNLHISFGDSEKPVIVKKWAVKNVEVD